LINPWLRQKHHNYQTDKSKHTKAESKKHANVQLSSNITNTSFGQNMRTEREGR